MKEQTIEVPMKVGSRIAILADVNMDDGGFISSTVFEDTVETYNETTGELEFRDSDIGLDEFEQLLDEYDSVQVVKE